MPSKLSEAEKRDVARCYRQGGCTFASLAEQFGISVSTVGRILRQYADDAEPEPIAPPEPSLFSVEAVLSSVVSPRKNEVELDQGLDSADRLIAISSDLVTVAPSQPLPSPAPFQDNRPESRSTPVLATADRRTRKRSRVITPDPILTDRDQPNQEPSANDGDTSDRPLASVARNPAPDLISVAGRSVSSGLDLADRYSGSGSSSAGSADTGDYRRAKPRQRYIADEEALATQPAAVVAVVSQVESEVTNKRPVPSRTTRSQPIIEDLEDDLPSDDFDDDLAGDDFDDDPNGEDGLLEGLVLARSIDPSQPIQVLPLADALIPSPCYLVVDRLAEPVTRPLKDFGELGTIPESEANYQALPVFDNHRIARRYSNRSDRTVKVPDGNVLHKTGAHLKAKGIDRLLIDGRVYAL